MATKRPTTFSMRMPEDLNEKITEYASKNNCTKAEAMSHFARAGIDLEENGPVPASVNAGEGEQGASQDTLASIEKRLEALQNLPTIEPSGQQTAIVPADIREKIQVYSAEHNCTEQEAMAYYARLGVQLSDEVRPASVKDLSELRTRLDALAQDSHSKNERLAQMSEMLESIRDYTKPDELELEGEVADDAEDVEPELTEEERQRLADERTRQIVSSVLEEHERKAEELELQRAAQESTALNPWIPVLVAVIVSLLIGLIVILTR